MDKFIDKVTEYHLMNYLLPGAAFWVLFEKMSGLQLVNFDLFRGFIFSYFAGMVISRVGSLLIEPLFIHIKSDFYAERTEYYKAEKEDEKLKELLRDSNMYRTMMMVCLAVILACALSFVYVQFPDMRNILKLVSIVILFIIFAFSFIKQTEHIKSRINKDKENEEEGIARFIPETGKNKDVLKKLEKDIKDFDRVLLVIDGKGVAKRLTDRVVKHIADYPIDKKLLVISDKADDKKEGNLEIRRIPKEDVECLLSIYRLYDFSDHFSVFFNDDHYGNVLNYVDQGMMKWDEALDAVING